MFNVLFEPKSRYIYFNNGIDYSFVFTNSHYGFRIRLNVSPSSPNLISLEANTDVRIWQFVGAFYVNLLKLRCKVWSYRNYVVQGFGQSQKMHQRSANRFHGFVVVLYNVCKASSTALGPKSCRVEHFRCIHLLGASRSPMFINTVLMED